MRKAWITTAVLAVLVAADAANASVLNAGGKVGNSAAEYGSCKYGGYGPSGILTVGVEGPGGTGANTRRGPRRERTWVRYRVEITDATNGYATVYSSPW